MNRKHDLYDLKAVGRRIAERRRELGLSQEELAEMIDRAPKYCSDIERGKCGMSIDTLLKFSDHLRIGLDYMIYGTRIPMTGSLKTDSGHLLIESVARCPEREQEHLLKIINAFNAAVKG